MNIIQQTNLSQYPLAVNKQPALFKRFNNESDSFTKTTVSTPSFKGGENIYAQILKNPQKAEQFMGLVAAGAAALIAAAGNAVKSDDVNGNGSLFTNLFAGLLNNKQDSNSEELAKYKQENEQLRQENEELRTKLAKPKTDVRQEQKNADKQNADLMKFEFPKKRGRITNNRQELKSVVENLYLSEEFNTKLFMICEELLNKNSHLVNNETKDNDEIAKDLAEELKILKDSDCKTKYVINKYFAICELAPKEENIAVEETNADPNFIAVPKLNGVKIKGKIDLPKKSEAENISELIKRDEDGNITSVYFKKAGTPSEYSAEQLDDILRFFVRTIYNDYKEKEKTNPGQEKPMWLYNTSLPKSIRPYDVSKEIKKKSNSEEKYKNIKKEHIRELVDLINEEPRYNDLFDIHSALRLIDRFVNFKSYDTGFDVQSKRILDKLFDMIGKAYKEGLYIDVYKEKNSGLMGLSITLDAKNFDQEAIDIFGPNDITIGLSERQNGKSYKGVENSRKEAIISTIY